MLKKYFMKYLIAIIFLFALNSGFASQAGQAFDGGPLQISIFPPYQLIPSDFDVYGVRLACYGQSYSVYGLDLGLWNRYRSGLYGVGFSALVSSRQGSMYGMNTAGIINYSRGDEVGWSLSGGINDVDGTVVGLQSTVFYNEAENLKGVQLALVNYCGKMNGLQMGLVNICEDQWIPFTIIFNLWFSSEDDEKDRKNN